MAVATPPVNAAPPPQPARVGRFELRRVLGRGGQATVWLAYDSRLDRDVAVKLITGDDLTLQQGLDEARSVSRLTHPNIVPVFEADVHGRQPYLVFEYVPGPTLAQHLRDCGAMAPHEAVVMMIGVLDALATAHAAGVVHRDLKPSNVLVDVTGRGRVMDFGIAARVQASGGPHAGGSAAGDVVGTPGYMSPEAIDGAAAAPAMDVFSAGLVLGEMLSGERLIAERDPHRAMSRTVNEAVVLPAGLSAAVDDPLRALLQRAVEREPARRWPSALAFREALQQWLAPTPADATRAVGNATRAAGNATLDFLLRRMRHKSDFPALSDSVSRIRRVTSSENESLASLSNEILKDVALTNKLLRLVNSAFFSNAGGGSVSTVSRAVALVGFAGIRNLAMSLVLLEHMHDKVQAGQLKEEFLRALMAGTLASELGTGLRDSEEAFIGAMFQNLGRLLTEYYFPEEARQVRSHVAAAEQAGRAGSGKGSEAAASIAVLGISFEELAVGVAKTWGLPEALQRCMRGSAGEPPSRPLEGPGEQLRWVALAANRITDALLLPEPANAAAKAAQVAHDHARVLGLSAARIEAATERARQRVAELAQAMSLYVPATSPTRRLLGAPAPPVVVEADDTLDTHVMQATITVRVEPPQAAREDVCEVLAAGIHDITNSMVESFNLNAVLRMVLETMYRALGFRRVVFCMRDAKTDTLTGRFGLGNDAAAVAALFKVPLKAGGADLFTAVCVKGVDTVISDATVQNLAARLPAWYRQGVGAPAFLLLPLLMKGKPFGLIYADKATPGGIEFSEKELSLVRTLRNQAVMAFMQKV